MKKILEFQNEYRWLSNFAPCSIMFLEHEYPSVEHAYQAVKNKSTEWREFCRTEKKAGVVKKESRKIQLREDWEDKKVVFMANFLAQKYQQEPYKRLLLGTGMDYIQEGNRWGDKFWGVCLKTGEGKNTLGVLIMGIRESLMRNL